MNKKLLIFDLDGTLINSLGDIAESLNKVLSDEGYRTYSLDEYRYLVGSGIRALVEQALPKEERNPQRVEQIRQLFLTEYLRNSDRYTKPYDGVVDLLEALATRKVRLAVASNKFDKGTKYLVKRFFPQIPFEMVLGFREEVPAKPNPAMVNEIISGMGVQRSEVLYIGDSNVDMYTATNAQVAGVGVTWGFRDRAELETAGATHIVDTPTEILELL